jgi:hypothetical protein
MLPIRGVLFAALTLGVTPRLVPKAPYDPIESTTLVKVSSVTLGLEVRFRGILLLPGEPMRVVEMRTPAVIRTEGPLVLGAFEPLEKGAILRLDYLVGDTIPTTVMAPRVMVGRSVGGSATAFVQGY